MKYLTPTGYRLADEGIPGTTALSDETLARIIARAEASIDSYIWHDTRIGGFEPFSGIWSQEGWNPKTRRINNPSHPVPIRQIRSFRVHVSNTNPGGAPFVATFLPGDCVVNEMEGYIEVVPLQSVLYSLTPVLAQFGLRPPLVLLDYDTGYYLPAWNERFFDSGNQTLYRAQRQFWATSYTQMVASQPSLLPAIPPVIYVNGVVVTSDRYTLDAMEGTITFADALDEGDIVSGDYAYQIPDPVREATIAQVTYTLAMRQLNIMGMAGIASMHSGDQSITRLPRRMSGHLALHEASMAPLAMELLAPYRQTPIG